LLTLGEGWHANHHEFPHSARHGLLPGQPDAVWCLIRGLEKVGLATAVQVPSSTNIEKHLAVE
jgi:fatty-acid desaturase